MEGDAADLKARNVSFSPMKDYIQLQDGQEASKLSDARQPLKSTPKKSALKPGHQTRLPNAERYQGKPVDLKAEFRDAKLVLFYFSSQWNAQHAKGTSRYPHEIKVIYVSVDTEEKHYIAATRNQVSRMRLTQPWLSMEWNDGSSENPEEEKKDEKEERKGPQESFLLADDSDLDASVVAADPAGTSYVRPFSRVYMAFKLNILMTPQIAVYNIPRHKFLDTNVRLSRLKPGRAQATIDIWLRGEPSPSINLTDMVYTVPWTAALVVVAIAYCLVAMLGGEQMYISNMIKRFS